MNLREARQAIRAAMQAVPEPSPAGNATVTRIDYGKCGAVIRGNVVSVALRTYCDVPAWSWTVRERGQWGRRTHYVWWLAKSEHNGGYEPGTLTAYTVTGNPSKDTFLALATTHVIEVEGLKLS